jgi:hypothetical protein
MLRSWIGNKNYFMAVFNTPIDAFKDCASSLACLPPGLLENRIGKEQ